MAFITKTGRGNYQLVEKYTDVNGCWKVRYLKLALRIEMMPGFGLSAISSGKGIYHLIAARCWL